MWEFQLMIESDKFPHLISIVDIKTIDKSEPKVFTFKAGKIESIITAMTMETEADNDLKVQGMYGTNKSDASNSVQANISRNNKFIGYNLFGRNIVNLAEENIKPIGVNDLITERKLQTSSANYQYVPIGSNATSTSVPFVSAGNIPNNNLNTNTYANISAAINSHSNLFDIKTVELSAEDIIKDYETALLDVYKQRTPSNSRLAIASVNKFVNEIIFLKNENGTAEVQPQHALPYIMLKLNLTIDGIHGLRCGNCIDVDYKPLRYSGGKTYFQITNITHSIQGAHWFTSFETIMRVNMNKVVPTPIFKTNSQAVNTPTNSNAKIDISYVKTIPGDPSKYKHTYSPAEDKKIMWLHPSIRNNVIDIYNELSAQGINVVMKAGLRSNEKQKEIFGRGRTADILMKVGYTKEDSIKYAMPDYKYPPPEVAIPGTSAHEYGFAMDIHPIDATGPADPKYDKIGIVVKKYGFAWGGDWSDKKKEKWHCQKGSMSQVKKQLAKNGTDSNGYVIL
jgi:hypothetical protein